MRLRFCEPEGVRGRAVCHVRMVEVPDTPSCASGRALLDVCLRLCRYVRPWYARVRVDVSALKGRRRKTSRVALHCHMMCGDVSDCSGNAGRWNSVGQAQGLKGKVRSVLIWETIDLLLHSCALLSQAEGLTRCFSRSVAVLARPPRASSAQHCAVHARGMVARLLALVGAASGPWLARGGGQRGGEGATALERGAMVLPRFAGSLATPQELHEALLPAWESLVENRNAAGLVAPKDEGTPQAPMSQEETVMQHRRLQRGEADSARLLLVFGLVPSVSFVDDGMRAMLEADGVTDVGEDRVEQAGADGVRLWRPAPSKFY